MNTFIYLLSQSNIEVLRAEAVAAKASLLTAHCGARLEALGVWLDLHSTLER